MNCNSVPGKRGVSAPHLQANSGFHSVPYIMDAGALCVGIKQSHQNAYHLPSFRDEGYEKLELHLHKKAKVCAHLRMYILAYFWTVRLQINHIAELFI